VQKEIKRIANGRWPWGDFCKTTLFVWNLWRLNATDRWPTGPPALAFFLSVVEANHLRSISSMGIIKFLTDLKLIEKRSPHLFCIMKKDTVANCWLRAEGPVTWRKALHDGKIFYTRYPKRSFWLRFVVALSESKIIMFKKARGWNVRHIISMITYLISRYL